MPRNPLWRSRSPARSWTCGWSCARLGQASRCCMGKWRRRNRSGYTQTGSKEQSAGRVLNTTCWPPRSCPCPSSPVRPGCAARRPACSFKELCGLETYRSLQDYIQRGASRKLLEIQAAKQLVFGFMPKSGKPLFPSSKVRQGPWPLMLVDWKEIDDDFKLVVAKRLNSKFDYDAVALSSTRLRISPKRSSRP